MSDKPTMEQIHHEYARLCQQAGHIQYTAGVQLEEINEKLKVLNVQAAELKKEEEEKKEVSSEA